VVPVGVDGGGSGRSISGCALDGICSGVRTGNEVVGVGVPKPKSLAAPEKGLADTRAATVGAHAVDVADAVEAGQGVVVGMVGAARAGERATAAGVVSGAARLVADVYAAVGIVSRVVGAADVGAGGNIAAVAGSSAAT
jgi:hypothetical protein